MASRDIANMHLFLDLKKKFPDLPDDTLRSYISLYADDQDKCINLLLRESKNHYNPSQPFADFRLPDGRVSSRIDDVRNPKECLTAESYNTPLPYPDMQVGPSRIQGPSGRSTSHAGVVHLPGKPFDPSTPWKVEPRSAPVMLETDKPFSYVYKQIPVSSQTSPFQTSSDKSKYNQMIFSTTKEHTINPSTSLRNTANLPVTAEAEPSKNHAVKLSIVPSFPFPQPQFSVINSSVSHSSKPGRHTTSLNFQLQPQSSLQYPIEISTIPTNIGDSSNSRDFGSHVQVSVGSQGATFTALRLQRPNYSQKTSHLPTCEESAFSDSLSSQAQNSIHHMPLDSKLQSNKGIAQFFKGPPHGTGQQTFSGKSAQYGSVQSYQLSPDYILAVKNHQIAQLDLVWQELEKEKSICSELKAKVHDMEQEIAKQSASKASVFNIEELNKLREENRKLRIECNCLSMEVDMSNSGQIPLGVTDEDFYANIFRGPNGAISSVESKDPSADQENLGITSKNTTVEDEDEHNHWKCEKCTFANHPALEKCEICEMPKKSGSFFDN